MKVLITGCAGFIGSHTSELFLSKGHHVVGIDNFDLFYGKDKKLKNLDSLKGNKNFNFHELDICDKQAFSKLPGDIECVIHLAAKAGIRPSIEAPRAYIDTNINGTYNLLE